MKRRYKKVQRPRRLIEKDDSKTTNQKKKRNTKLIFYK